MCLQKVDVFYYLSFQIICLLVLFFCLSLLKFNKIWSVYSASPVVHNSWNYSLRFERMRNNTKQNNIYLPGLVLHTLLIFFNI